MYAKKHRPMQKLTAICLSVSIAAASLLSTHVFASEQAPEPSGEYLTGQDLLNELRKLGLGQEYITEDPVPEVSAPESSETSGETSEVPVVDPSEPVIEPSEPVIEPSEPVVEPSEPVVEPSEPVVEPSEPEVDTTEPETDGGFEQQEVESTFSAFRAMPRDVVLNGNPDTEETPTDPIEETPEESSEQSTESSELAKEPSDEVPVESSVPSSEPVSEPSGEVPSEPSTDPVDPEVSVDPSKPVEEIPEESVPGTEVPAREVLVTYVQALDAEQIVSLNDTDITYNEYVSFYSMISEQQIKQLFDYYYPTVEMTDPAPLNISRNYQTAMRAPAKYVEPKDDGLYLKKSVTPKAGSENQYTVKLEAFSTGTVITETSSVPIDVVLVLDQSGSMRYSFDDEENVSYEQSRQYAMQNSVKKFIESVCTASDPQNPNTIGIVSFNSEGHNLTAGLQKCNENPSSYFTDIIDNLGSKPSGATNVGAGMQLAEQMVPPETEGRKSVVIVFTDGVPTTGNTFDTTVANTALSSSKKIKNMGADVYTIGIFGGADESKTHGDVYRYLNEIIWKPYKEYPCDGSIGSFWGVSDGLQLFHSGDVIEYDVGAGNRFLNYLSSNFMDATEIGIHFDNRGYPNNGKYWVDRGPGYYIDKNAERHNTGYYMTAGDQSGLDTIFENISNTIVSPSANLDEETRIVDTLSDYFEFVGTKPSDVRITTKAMTYSNGSFIEGNDKGRPEGVSASIDDGQVTVTGFDFNHYFVSTTDEASEDPRKLIIEFDITTVDGFIGGNQVPTNGEAYVERDEGQDEEGKDIPYFRKDFLEHPTVDVGINYSYGTADKTIYLSNEQELKQLFTSDKDHPINSINNRFVDIVYEVRNGQTLVGVYTINANVNDWDDGIWEATNNGKVSPDDCTEYSVTCTVKPISEGEVKETLATPVKDGDGKADDGKAWIHVLKPELQFKDTKKDSGTSITAALLEGENYVSATWKCKDGMTTPTDTTAVVPTITIQEVKIYQSGTWTTQELPFDLTAETDFQVTKIKLNGSEENYELTTHFTVKDPTCEVGNYEHSENDRHFTIHLNNFDLTIKKIAADAGDGEQFRFTVTGSNGFSASFMLEAGDEITLKDLSAGNYTITEDTDWSWRYDSVSATVNGTSAQLNNGSFTQNFTATSSVVFTNSNRDNHWLSWEDTVNNIFKAFTGAAS